MPTRVAYILKMFPRLSETFVLGEILELERQGVEVEIVSLMHPVDGRFHGQLSELKATVHYVPREKPETLWDALMADGRAFDGETLVRASQFLRSHGIPKDLDLVLRSALIARHLQRRGVQHVHAHFATIATRVAALVQEWVGIPFSFTSHAKDIFRETVDRSLYAALVDRAQFNVTVSDYNQRFLVEHTPGLDRQKIIRLYNGIDLSAFQAAPTPRGPHPLHVASIGRLVPKKGFDVLLRALALWKSGGAQFRCTVVGDGDDRAALHSLCSDLHLDDEVHFAGARPQEEVIGLLASADVVALACVKDADGNQDALPTVLLEALAMDLPIVSTDIAGVPEIVGDEAGLVVEPGDAPALAAALQRIVDAPPEPGVARQRAERLFDRRVNVAELRKRFERSANGAAS